MKCIKIGFYIASSITSYALFLLSLIFIGFPLLLDFVVWGAEHGEENWFYSFLRFFFLLFIVSTIITCTVNYFKSKENR